MGVRLWAWSGLLLGLLAGCGGDVPSEPAGPAPKTEVIKTREGATETVTTIPIEGDNK